MARFPTVFLALALVATSLFPCANARAAEQIGQACQTLGASVMAADQKNLIVCLKDDDTNALVWKSMTSAKVAGVPVGAVIAWPVATNPKDMQNPNGTYNWLDCNGQAITSTLYPELYAVIGATLPDFRGLFLRGLGGNSAALGAVQADMVGTHTHHINRSTGGSGNSWIGNGGGGNRGDWTDNWGSNMGAETRPRNQAVRYLIRARS